MREWRKRRMERKRRNGKDVTFRDMVLEVLFWIPEIIIFPFRIVFGW